ncbi:MAG TPA: hypothetical protein VIV61_07685 [Candidatus Ozemobacteraceae bacterium]
MACDEVLGRSMLIRGGAAFARFYRWSPPTLSFGFFQPVERLIDPAAAATAGIGLVRRSSGGKMVFHADEITFAIGMPLRLLRGDAPGSSDFLTCFRAVMQPLVDALSAAGVPARFSADHEIESGRSDRIHCYAAAAGHSVYAGPKKLVGAAGIVKGEILTVHGSLPITRTPLPGTLFLGPARSAVLPDIAVLTDFIGAEEIGMLPGQIAGCLAERFNLVTAESEYEPVESREIEILSREKYARLDWKSLPSATWEESLASADLQDAHA